MKKLLFAFMLVGAAAVVNAQDTTSTQSPTDPTSTTTPTEATPSQTTPTDDQSTAATQEDGRVKIKSQELPDAVKKSLEGQEYRGWLVNSAYKMESASTTSSSSSSDPNASSSSSSSGSVNATSDAYGKEVYLVELKNGAQTKTVRFDKDGKKLDDQGMENDQK
jgi:hypothetical protein